MPHVDPVKRKAATKKWQLDNRSLCYSRYKTWSRTERGWAVGTIKGSRGVTKRRGGVALNISVEGLIEKAHAWDRRCQCCGSRVLTLPFDSVTGPKAHVDHCHKTGLFRGFVCAFCNISLGFVEDTENVKRCVAYLISTATN